jgi:hypothetical protein
MRRIAVGVVVLAVGIALAALGIFRAADPAEPLAWLVIPAGLVFVFGGALVLLPAKLQLPLAALMVTSLAVMFDWVAFGPGERHFTSSLGAGSSRVTWSGGELAGRAFFGVFAVLMDIAAIGLWLRLVRRFRNGRLPAGPLG